MISHWKTGARYEQMLKLMIEQFPEVEKRDKVEILELAAGTGGVGEQLHRHGFRSMDAVHCDDRRQKSLKFSPLFTITHEFLPPDYDRKLLPTISYYGTLFYFG